MLGRKTEILSNKTDNLENLESLKAYIGKKVFSKLGNKIGVVKDVLTQNNKVKGFIVKGKKNIFVDTDYVASFSEKSVMLSIDPVTILIGKQVFDSTGRRIGKVVGLERKTNANNYESLIVKRRMLSKQFTVSKKEVDVSKENIILKKKYPKK